LFSTFAAGAQTIEPESILGTDYLAIQAAMPEFEAKGLDISKYRIFVWKEDSSIIVLFDDPNRPPGIRGSSPNLRTFGVELRASDLKVLKANFQR
jgi:hypothetical protein